MMYTIENGRFKFIEPQIVMDDVHYALPSSPPYWLVFEGDDDTGKTTVAHTIKIALTQMGIDTVVEAEGKFSDPKMCTIETYWGERSVRHRFLADLYRRGITIIQDRSWLSTVIYQYQHITEALMLMNVMYGALGVAPDAVFVFEGKDGFGLYDKIAKHKGIIVPSVGKIVPIVPVRYLPATQSDCATKRAFDVVDFISSGTFLGFYSSKWGGERGDGGGEGAVLVKG